VVAAHETVGVGIDRLRRFDHAIAKEDGHAPRASRGVVAQRDDVADQRRVHFVRDAVQTDGAILLDCALLLEEKHVPQFPVWQADVGGRRGPALARGGALQAAVRRVQVFVFDPRPEAPVERVERAGIRLEERGEQLGADGSKIPFDFSLRQSSQMHTRWTVRHEPSA